MSERDELVEAIYFVLYHIKSSRGYQDTAQQVADHLRDKGFDTADFERVQELERENRILARLNDSLRLQWKAQEVRKQRRGNNT
jgi:hypothetical protein